jgi:hypothetical protein
MKRRVTLLTAFALLGAGVFFSANHAPAQQVSQERWDYQEGRLVYGFPDSDIVDLVVTCRRGTADVDIMIRPPHGKPGDESRHRCGARR